MLLGHLVRAWIWAFDGQRLAVFIVHIQAVGAGALAYQVDDLVLEDGGEPGAQGGAAGERGTAGQHGLEHIVHHVFGKHRVVQAGLCKTHQGAAVRHHVAPGNRNAHLRIEAGGEGVGGGLRGAFLEKG